MMMKTQYHDKLLIHTMYYHTENTAAVAAESVVATAPQGLTCASAVEAFYRSAAMQKRLNADEVHDLFLALRGAERAGDKQQADALITRLVAAHLHLVTTLVSSYRGEVDREELLAVGVRELVKAIRNYDVQRGRRFDSYADQWLRQGVRRAHSVSRCGCAPFNHRAAERARKLQKLEENLSTELGYLPTAAELAERSGLSIGEFQEAQVACQPCYSLHQPMHEDSTCTYEDQLADEAGDMFEDLNSRERRELLLHDIRLYLTPKEQYTVLHRFGLTEDGTAESCDGIAEALGVSRSRVNQYLRQACDKLRSVPRINELRDSLCA